jgi:hypothetical protein
MIIGPLALAAYLNHPWPLPAADELQVMPPMDAFVRERGLKPVWRDSDDGPWFKIGLYTIGRTTGFVWYFPRAEGWEPETHFVECTMRADDFVGTGVTPPDGTVKGTGWCGVILDRRVERVCGTTISGTSTMAMPYNGWAWLWVNESTQWDRIDALAADGTVLYSHVLSPK